MLPVISIIIANYNQKSYLRKAIALPINFFKNDFT